MCREACKEAEAIKASNHCDGMSTERRHCGTNTCLCTMCRCGDHVCPQQIAQNLSQTLQDLDKREPSSWRKDPEPLHCLKNYYCPPHCAGTSKQRPTTNCLIPYKDKFNLGPPEQKESGVLHANHQPFAKHTNYMLDYSPYEIQASPISEIKLRKSDIGQSSLPFSSDTTHKKDFVWPPEGCKKLEKGKGEGRKSTLKVGDGPMTDQSSNMLDYKDLNVNERMPVRRPKDVFRPPTCRMEAETTSKASYPRWKDLPIQPVSKNITEDRCEPLKSDVRFLVTTYQEDFDGLHAALCPAKTVENYGRKAVEPKYRFVCAGSDHEYYECGNDNTDMAICK
ncbi:hypothetical protein HNY73_014042 [Argiope bruennichi]|uniref:Uncharacterized protein n=1 Tax=Argiope bruennichi TaxID=94029 RepID=A0A8T0EP29_ARGBR|nr:hypothetical protein HNY73_014042 [Argiope bruennichi]